jgi:hypothetical protein
MQLALKLFRGEPAITEFDKNFSPIHNSSPSVAQLVCSVLRPLLHGLQPGHGLLTRFRVMYVPPCALFRLGFPMPSRNNAVKQATHSILAGSFFNRNTVTLAGSGSL